MTLRTTVLVGFAEALAAPEVVWSLVDEGYRVVAFARRGRKSAIRHSQHVQIHEIQAPESDIQGALSELRALMDLLAARGEGSQALLFPLDDTAVWLSSRVSREGNWVLAGPQGPNAELALNKCLQTQLARDAGFAVPPTLMARTAKEIFAFSEKQHFPIILKPVECVPVRENRIAGTRKWICNNQAELEHAVQQWGETVPLLAQPFILGVGEGIFGVAAKDGIRAWSAHKRLRMMNPQGSGSSACISQPVSPEIAPKVKEFIRKCSWQGLFMIELLRDDSGNTWFVELNGRPWGSMALARCQGLDYPAWHANLAMDRESTGSMSRQSTPGVVCRHFGREFMHLLFVLKGPKSQALSNWPPFWKTLVEMMRFRRGDGVYNWRREDPKVFLADCYYTIHSNLFKSKS